MKTDGSDYTVIAEGNYTNINATETDVYFRDFASGVMYKTPIADPSDVEIFNPGTGSSDKCSCTGSTVSFYVQKNTGDFRYPLCFFYAKSNSES